MAHSTRVNGWVRVTRGACIVFGAALFGAIACSSSGTEEISTASLAVSNSGSCTVSQDDRVLTQHIEVVSTGTAGGTISISADREVDLSLPGANRLIEQGVLRIGGSSEIFSYALEAQPGAATQVWVSWGPHVRGAEEGTFSIEDGMISGSIDGRAFLPLSVDADPASARFVDGGPSPVLRSNRPLQQALERLAAAAEKVMRACEGPTTPGLAALPPVLQFNREQDPGHFSDTYSTTRCDACKVLVVGGGAAAGVGCGFVCVGTLGIGCGACIAGDAAAVTAGILACEESNACCPKACASGIGSPCCFGDETCLEPGTGLCCSSGTQACAGQACCASDQSCIDAGPKKGTCCPDDSTCGQNCCDDDEVCQDAGTGKCCSTNKVCGSACCDTDDLDVLYCANASLGLCCSHGAVECGGACCGGPGSNRECRAGQCVLKPTLDCGGRPACVDPVTGEQVLSDQECPYGGGGAPGFCNLFTGCCDNPPA